MTRTTKAAEVAFDETGVKRELAGNAWKVVAGVALEVDFSGNGLGNEDISLDGREFERCLIGPLHKQLPVR